MSKYKYFKDSEVEGLVEDLVYKLDRAREYYGNPILITSGYRDPSKNESVGGVKGSAHTKGLAVDIRLSLDPFIRAKMAWALGAAGFRRVIFYDRHVHVDVDRDRAMPLFMDGGKSH